MPSRPGSGARVAGIEEISNQRFGVLMSIFVVLGFNSKSTLRFSKLENFSFRPTISATSTIHINHLQLCRESMICTITGGIRISCLRQTIEPLY